MVALFFPLAAAAQQPKPCIEGQLLPYKNYDEACADFCNDRCSFFNSSLGETGRPFNKTVWRWTPKNVTGIQNKDTGDAPGDISFFLSKKSLAQECARDPTGWGCFLDGDNLYGRFIVEMDGQLGPYFECNPENVIEPGGLPWKPRHWVDTQTFACGQGCLQPVRGEGCGTTHRHERNGTYGFGGAMMCTCDGTRRHERTVGRELPPFAAGRRVGPAAWPPQCNLAYYAGDRHHPGVNECLDGAVLANVSGWDFMATSAAACDACTADARCTGWRTADNLTAELLTGPLAPTKAKACIAGNKYHSRHGGGVSWGTAGSLGGFWFSTPISAECAAGAPLGTDGCAWRVVASTYRNASCVDGRVDAAVEVYGKACFESCAQPLNHTSSCYLRCYKNTLLGDPALNLTAMPHEKIVAPWKGGFDVGGCPEVTPAPCEGPQCGGPP